MIERHNLYGESFLHRKENNSFSTSFMYYTKAAWRNMSFKFNHLSGRGEICIRVNLSTGQWVYLYTVFSNFRVQNRGDICIHKRSKQEWNLYTKVEGKGCICILYFINLKDFFRVKAKVTFVYFCQISDEICILLVNRELVLWDEPNVRLG